MGQVKKIVVVGSRGMAGHVIYFYLKQKPYYNVIDIARTKDALGPIYSLDVSDFAALESVLDIEKPDVVINCIGVLNQDAENNPDKAILFNSYFPHFLARIGKNIGFKVIHISTDCVFDGKKGNYTENSFKDGVGFYAGSKALGEINYENNLTIRTSIIGPELKENGIGLFHWFMHQSGAIKGYTKAYWTGVTTIELAKAIDVAIAQDIIGLHHLVNETKISKYQLVNLFKDIFAREDLLVEKYDLYKINKSLVKTDYTFNYVVPSYKDMIEEMKLWILQKANLYSYNI